jgi:hypothetical protein
MYKSSKKRWNEKGKDPPTRVRLAGYMVTRSKFHRGGKLTTKNTFMPLESGEYPYQLRERIRIFLQLPQPIDKNLRKKYKAIYDICHTPDECLQDRVDMRKFFAVRKALGYPSMMRRKERLRVLAWKDMWQAQWSCIRDAFPKQRNRVRTNEKMYKAIAKVVWKMENDRYPGKYWLQRSYDLVPVYGTDVTIPCRKYKSDEPPRTYQQAFDLHEGWND